MKDDLALQVKDLSVELSGQKIIENLSFSVKKGETLVILGPNGAGKTTLLRAILGILPYKGDVQWSVKNLSYLPPKDLMQTKEIVPLTVEDFFSLKNISRKRAQKCIESVGLPFEIYKKRLAHLSSGQFQRLGISWALADDPDMLIFDEPTSGIDIGGTETIYSLLHKFWQMRKMSIILVTHDLSVVWGHADNVLCLNKKGICYGPPRQALAPGNLEELYGSDLKYYKHANST